MVKSKRQATKSRTADLMTPPRSPVVEIQQPVHNQEDPPAVKVPMDSSSESELPPLPKVQAHDQHPITLFFSKSPATKDKGKQVLREDKEVEEEIEQAQPVTKRMKLPVRRSVRTEKEPQPKAQASSPDTAKEILAPEKQQKPTKVDKKIVSTSRKRKTEAEKLKVPGQVKPSTRLRQKSTPSPKSTPSSPPTKPPPTTEEDEEPRPKIRRKQVARRSKMDDLATKTFYPFISAKAKASFESSIRHKQPIKERALDWEAAEVFIKDIITSLHWEQ